VPIGRPIANVSLYVLDPELEPVPINCLGELHIGGIALATGYTGNAKVNAEKFVPDPFSEFPGARMYQTGDIARYLPDGNLDFVGRIDSQVKVRGARVELGEIQATLSSHPAIKDCAVLVKHFGENDQRLLSYVVFANGVQSATEELRRYLGQWLPDYMIPSAFIPLEAIPTTPNGKVDQVSLLQAATDWKPSPAAGVAARTPIEARLCEIWSEVLQLSDVGVDDNFFALGGHSSLAMQLIGKIRREFQLDVTLEVIFSAEPTVASLAQILEELGANNAV
jgi:acyl carrier protein